MSDPREFVDQVADELAEMGAEPLLTMDGFDDCIMGVAVRYNHTFVVYDYEKVIEKLMSDGMTREEAMEFHEFNQEGGWVGDATPAFLRLPPTEKQEEQ